MKRNILQEKSYNFSIRIIKLFKYLNSDKKEYILSKQIIRSGTAVGALVREGEFAQSKADFINKLSIGLKEANETSYWLDLLKDSDYLEKNIHDSLQTDCKELIKILVSIIKTSKSN